MTNPIITGDTARVTAVHKERYEIYCEHGETYARLKSAVYFSVDGITPSFPTTGDFVRIQYNPSGDSLIVDTLERSSYFSRRDPTPGRGEQAVAANFDYVFILTSLNHDLNYRRLERYITLAWQSGGTPVIVLTKADLASEYADIINNVEKIAAGIKVFAVSAHTGYGLDALADFLTEDKTIVFLGSSGVGKSSLVNALAGKELMDVREIREDDSRGRHTTTYRQLIRLDSGVMIIDTPGMRELGMWDVSQGLGEAFGDVDEFIGKCRFTDCTHGNEPGCAVRQAIADGLLSEERWESYKKLKKEAKYSDSKTSFMQTKQQWMKSISKTNKLNKKNMGKCR